MNHETIVTQVVTELKNIRVNQGVSQRELASRTALSQAGIAHMELGNTTPTLLFLLSVCEALDVDLKDLLETAQIK